MLLCSAPLDLALTVSVVASFGECLQSSNTRDSFSFDFAGAGESSDKDADEEAFGALYFVSVLCSNFRFLFLFFFLAVFLLDVEVTLAVEGLLSSGLREEFSWKCFLVQNPSQARLGTGMPLEAAT